MLPEIQRVVRDDLIAARAPKEAETLKAVREQQGFAEQFRAEVLQSVADSVDFKKADELIAAAREDVDAA